MLPLIPGIPSSEKEGVLVRKGKIFATGDQLAKSSPSSSGRSCVLWKLRKGSKLKKRGAEKREGDVAQIDMVTYFCA